MRFGRVCVLCAAAILCGHFGGCRKSPYASGTLAICYSINSVEGVVPSGQTVVWLEDAAGEIVSTLMVSNYLSMGGYKREGVCPAWSGKSGWGTKEQADVAAVTRATPEVKEHVLKADCRKRKLVGGRYRYFVQVHIVKDYNILYSGEIVIGGEDCEDVARVSRGPGQHDKGSTALSGVKARYYR
jgi:hypothetical protein